MINLEPQNVFKDKIDQIKNLEPQNVFKDKIDQIKNARTNQRNIIGTNLAINNIFFKKIYLIPI